MKNYTGEIPTKLVDPLEAFIASLGIEVPIDQKFHHFFNEDSEPPRNKRESFDYCPWFDAVD